LNTAKAILEKYQIGEDQAPAILAALKIGKKKSTDELNEAQVLSVDQTCHRIKGGKKLEEAVNEVLEEARKTQSALAHKNGGKVAVIDPPIPQKTVVSLRDYAEQTIPPDAVKQFVGGALDGVDDVAYQYTPANGKKFGTALGNEVASRLETSEEEIQREIQERLGKHNAKASG
jgi:hypothetical protein